MFKLGYVNVKEPFVFKSKVLYFSLSYAHKSSFLELSLFAWHDNYPLSIAPANSSISHLIYNRDRELISFIIFNSKLFENLNWILLELNFQLLSNLHSKSPVIE